MMTRANGGMASRGLELALFVTAMVWAAGANVVAGRAAAGIAGRFGWSYGQLLLEALFLLFLVVVGFQALEWVSGRGVDKSEVMALPGRATSGREWGTGAAIGWGLCLAAVLPVLLAGKLHAQLNRGSGLIPGILAAVATLLVVCLAEEVIFRGFPFRRLVAAAGTGWATVVMSVIFAVVLVAANPPRNTGLALLDGTLFGVLLAMAYLRTNALWVGWGLHFSYRAVMAVVVGLPIVGISSFGSVMDAGTSGPRWLTGGFFGLDAALLTAFVLAGGMVVLYRATQEWKWAYATPEIVAAGYEVVVAPPAAHVAMEQAAAPPPLVQILPVTSQSFSVGTTPETPVEGGAAKQ